MSLSLIGIIFVQAYYINNSIKNEEEQFTFNVKRALIDVSSAIEQKEYREYVYKFQELMARGVTVDTTLIRNLFIVQDDQDSNETLIYRNGILEENYKLSSSLFDIGLDSINIKRILNERETKIYKSSDVESGSFSPEERLLLIHSGTSSFLLAYSMEYLLRL